MNNPIIVNPYHPDPRVSYAVECSNCPIIDKADTIQDLKAAILNHICQTEEED